MMPYKAVLFDLDGTLVDSAEDLTHAINVILERRGYKTLSVDVVANCLGKGAPVLVRKVAAIQGITLTDEAVKQWVEEYSSLLVAENNRLTRFFPGVLESIRRLRAQGMVTAVVTNKQRATTEAFLKSREVESLFDVVVAGDDTDHPKPEGDMLILAMDKLHVSPTQTVMVGDSQNDALAARAAGVRAMLVSTGYNEGTPIAVWASEWGFDVPYPSIEKVVDAILK